MARHGESYIPTFTALYLMLHGVMFSPQWGMYLLSTPYNTKLRSSQRVSSPGLVAEHWAYRIKWPRASPVSPRLALFCLHGTP
jgi:hypothetical protein